MRRIINSASVSIFVQFALGTAHLFAASNDSNSNDGNSGLFGAIVGVIVPALLVIGIGGGIYVWLRRNKASFARLFPRRRTPANWDVSQPTYTPASPSPVPRCGAVRPGRSDRGTEPDTPVERDEYTLESISLTDLEQALSLRESDRIEEYCESIAMIIKQYVGEKYQIKILDATTGQILSALPDDLTDTVTDHVGEILRMCDMIHFSRHRPSRSELDRIYQTAKEFIESQIAVAPVETDESEAEEEADENSEIYEHYRRRF